ncbi:sigma factor [Paracoccus benzoatiresistens]|uniref:Sigma factor n=1 Tax=Paracoccus benzoatiresistens TaxID=2997341 RepID=A0ABT4J7Y8_9RHOB|nr:sigma factor [Paracoccus sp. EF6]MCZ0963208.1 sigma factor [Paracoccus sp. EF6]
MPDTRRTHLQDLITRVAKGDRPAFDALYQATSAQLNAICLSVLRDRREAEEALEQSFIQIWKTAPQFAESGLSPMAWLATLARDRAIDSLRRQEAHPAAVTAPAMLPDAGLAEALSDPVLAVRHAYLQGLDPAGFAQRTGLSVEAARQHLHEGLAEMAAEFLQPDEVLAAELALGLTDASAAEAATRASTDPAFARRLRDWQERLALLAGDLTPVMAPARARQRIRENLGHGLAPLAVDPLERTPWWRGTAGVLAAILLAAAVGVYLWMG